LTVFLDTGYFIALMLRNDQWHSAAAKLSIEKVSLVTSSQVVSETISLLQVRGHFSLALDFLANVSGGDELRIVFPDEAIQRAAWEEFRHSGGFGANAVDCLSFTIMRKLRIRKAWTFDRHFAAAGFETAIRAS